MYLLVEPSIPEGIIVEGDMLGLMPTLKYVDHDVTCENKFMELVLGKFFLKSISSKAHMIFIEPQVWARGLQKVGLLKLFNIPHFGRIQEITACMKMLLSFVHRGYLWLDRPISIDIYLIVHIKVLPLKGLDPMP
jgi:hypothetical protein